ncbi:hypothetical protein RRF57_011209 [Xylaria bambusicola]|uniref:Phosphoglycerate mutase n=1 Tax=Xylaria bambusicola TaxID=326684 RepID=A0AAN7Z9Y7_9PEZI
MPVTIWLVRHAESVANVTQNGDLHDPELTDLGRQQCASLREDFAKKRVDLVFVSPMQRAIQTALEIFPESSGLFVEPTDNMILLPELQERGGAVCAPCDIGSPPDWILEKYGDTRFDHSHMTIEWTNKRPGSFYAPENARKRARFARKVLRDTVKPYEGTDLCIVVVTHGRFLQFLTESSVVFHNAEARPYVFAPADEDDTEAKLVEVSPIDDGDSSQE